jgi:2-oxoglutarate dehydrogenase E2 component (dihydrolipoamide succinyltransferase)
MDTKIRVPAIVNGGVRLSIGRWFKRPGDPVSVDEPLVEIDTDNITHEIRSPVTGVLTSISARDGATVEPGTIVGLISDYSIHPSLEYRNDL